MYAYALEAVEQEARSRGTSIIEAREEFDGYFREETLAEHAQSSVEPKAKIRDQHQAQTELMAAMGMGARV